MFKATMTIIQNCMRDLNCQIGGNDADVLVNKMTMTNNVYNFSFVLLFREENKRFGEEN